MQRYKNTNHIIIQPRAQTPLRKQACSHMHNTSVQNGSTKCCHGEVVASCCNHGHQLFSRSAEKVLLFCFGARDKYAQHGIGKLLKKQIRLKSAVWNCDPNQPRAYLSLPNEQHVAFNAISRGSSKDSPIYVCKRCSKWNQLPCLQRGNGPVQEILGPSKSWVKIEDQICDSSTPCVRTPSG